MEGKKSFTSRKTPGDAIEIPTWKSNKRHRRATPPRQDWATMISVIIPAHNEEDYIGMTLDALSRQNYPYFEVIVVANGCHDRTAQIALKACDRLVVLSDKNLGVARNLGAKLARGELLMFLDADTVLEPGALEIVAHKFTHEYATGTFKGRPDNCERWSFRVIYAVKNFIHRWALHRGSSGVILCWKRDFLAARGFDEALQVRENSELIRRLGIFGKYRYIGETAATTSMRRYQTAGTGRMIFYWFKLWLQSLFSDLRNKEYETVR
ncbi:MAG TPA: glycosyltransferase [Verrucomicrobiae bacterium]|nr:glycosyltransferase [Verrucomicrobiae bacterium]